MKTQSLFTTAFVVVGCFAFTACQKQAPTDDINSMQTMSLEKAIKTQEHQIKGEYTSGHYSFVPDMEAGYVAPNPAPGWYPGVATEGHLNLLGSSQAFVNMYATFGPGGLQGAPASLNLFFANELNDMDISLPDAVAVILFDKQGNSIWARANGTIAINPVTSTHVTFSIDAEILGGTGKFVNATGSLVGLGYFNPQNTNDVGFQVTDGTIVY